MKKILFVILLAVLVPVSSASANMMAGRGGFFNMMFQSQSPADYEKLQGYFEKMEQGNLPADEQKDMMQMMNGGGKAAVFNKFAYGPPQAGFGMMGSSMMGAWGLSAWVSTINLLLIWAIMILIIYALIKWLKKKD